MHNAKIYSNEKLDQLALKTCSSKNLKSIICKYGHLCKLNTFCSNNLEHSKKFYKIKYKNSHRGNGPKRFIIFIAEYNKRDVNTREYYLFNN